MRKALVPALFLALLVALAQALNLDLRPYLVKAVEGKETYEENPLGVRPGDLLEWRLLAENRSQGALRQVALVIPIPKETRYLEGTAKPLSLGSATIRPEFSFDGGKTFGFPPLKKRVRVVENGKEVEKEVEVKPEEYTHARWVLPEMPKGARVQVSLRTVVK
ncbi:hypothetical protein [Thermus sp.]|uniref:hypothetical protein n=1 Tax=Thermus sp. TaxID=275 RepID=UPI0025D5BF7D|nr:hypothetical protein [Thermus sp.]MCS6869231.1 hypothetical protein [Thermus sp.]